MAFLVGDIEGRLTLDRTPYTEGLRIAREQADAFERNKIEAHVEPDTAKANAELSKTRVELERLDHTRATPTVSVNTRDSQRGLGLLATSIIALGPAAIAAGGIAAGALAPLALGVAGVAAVALPMLKNLHDAATKTGKAQQDALTKLGPGAGPAVQAMQTLLAAWKQFQQALSPQIFGLLSQIFGLIEASLPALIPFISGVTTALTQMVQGLTPLAPIFGQAFTAMLPIVNLMTQGALHMAEALAHWTQGQGFQQFIAYVVKNGPLLAHTLGDLARLIIQIGIAAGPLLPPLLRITGALAQMLTLLLRIPGVGPAIVTLAAIAVTALKVDAAFRALTGPTGAITRLLPVARAVFLGVGRAAMALFANPVGLAIAAVIIATILIIKHWDAVKKALAAVWNFLKGVAHVAFDAIKKAAEIGLLGPVGLIITHWDRLKNILAGIWNAIRSAASTSWNAIKDAIVHPIEDAWNWIKGLPSKFYDAGKKIIEQFVNGIKSVAMAPVNAVKNVVGKVRDLLPFSEPKDSTSPLHGLSRSGEAIVKNILYGFHQASPALRFAMQNALGRNLMIPQLGAGRNIAWAGPAGSGITGSTYYGDTHVNINTARGHYPHAKAVAMDLADEFSRRQVRRQK
jgi:hypothetical protein